MAFNFNWSPLIADTSKAREMLTAALNKSPKPPIIVDDILVTELNLGSVPPELEILEIGDLAEDRFRGIFKMTYSGDAYLTLKTRVQANPLNTYLSTKPSFASPQPLAASSSLTIPLQITLSDIALSGFVILVFSRQKGITLVFRNDPLESLKVSSTFDSIPFVRDYLQKVIESQLRVLFMEDLPAIIHRLSLRLFVPEHAHSANEVNSNPVGHTTAKEGFVDPLATPSQRPIDLSGRVSEDFEPSEFSLDNGSEVHASFSQKNLLRLAALNDSHRTLSLFSPPIRDSVFRAWAGAAERGDFSGTATPAFTFATLARQHSSHQHAASTQSCDGASNGSFSSRPSLSATSLTGLSIGGNRSRPHGGRKRKHRVVNLRKPRVDDGDDQNIDSRPPTPSSATPSSHTGPRSEEREEELITPPDSPERKNKGRVVYDSTVDAPTIVSPQPRPKATAFASQVLGGVLRKPSVALSDGSSISPTSSRANFARVAYESNIRAYSSEKSSPLAPGQIALSGGILEQAWMMKMASEVARKVQLEKASAGEANANFWSPEESSDGLPPPAYAA